MAAPASGQRNGSLVVVGWGGSFQDCQRKAYFQPFEQETHIKVIESSGPILAKVRAMVESGNVEWDVFMQNGSGVISLQKRGYLERVDYTVFRKQDLESIDPRVRLEYGVGSDFYAATIGYSTKKYSKENHPRTWAEFWDVTRYPGKRALYAGDYVISPIEWALMADGVPPDKLYPLDLDRAYRSLSRIKPHVVKWLRAGPPSVEILINGEADLSTVGSAYTQRVKREGAPIDMDWNQGSLYVDYWAIPKNAKNRENGQRFVAFASRPGPQAELSACINFGPTNQKAYEWRRTSTDTRLITPEQRVNLPSYSENLKKMVLISDSWWGETHASGKTNLEVNAEMWNRWLLR